MRFLPGGLLIGAVLIAGCSSASTPTPAAVTAAVTHPGQVVSEAQASAARSQTGKPQIKISGAVGSELAYAYNPDAPPPPRLEKAPPKPSKNAVWHPGRWFWATWRWLWLSGFWK